MTKPTASLSPEVRGRIFNNARMICHLVDLGAYQPCPECMDKAREMFLEDWEFVLGLPRQIRDLPINVLRREILLASCDA